MWGKIFELAPFYEKGRLVKVNELFGDELIDVMPACVLADREELNEVLVG